MTILGAFRVINEVNSFSQSTMVLVPRRATQLCRDRNREDNILTALYTTNEETEFDTTAGSRYICLFQDYEKTTGPYFFALFDQLLEQTLHKKKHVAFLTTQKDIDALSTENEPNTLESKLETIKSFLDLDRSPEVFVLEEWNPLALEERFGSTADRATAEATTQSQRDQMNIPTVVWLYGRHNGFYTRHMLRTSGFDRWIQEQCASSYIPGLENCVFIGEGTGALCAGVTMDPAKARGDDANGAPELQVYGLNLLGDESTGVVFVDGNTTSEQKSNLIDRYCRLEICLEDEVFVWAQPPLLEEQVATKFVMAPNRRGTIEKHATLDPLPPLIIRSNADEDKTEGIACYGEPSIDPSRSAQAETIGDSEWWE